MSPQVYNHDRARTFLHFYTNGATLQEIGDAFGITRERVRQILEPFGTPQRMRNPVCPIRALAVARKARGLNHAAETLKVRNQALRVCLIELGAWPAMERLWRWRMRTYQREYTDAALLGLLRTLANRLGRTPTLKEIEAEHGTWPTVYYQRFGTMGAAMRRAGLTPRTRGARGHTAYRGAGPTSTTCVRGHDLTAPQNVYLHQQKGKMVRRCRECHKACARRSCARKQRAT